MARKWAEVPSYGEYLDRVLGPGSLPALLDELERRAGAILEHGRTVFRRWLDLAAAGL
jgi:hypothetical protein